MTDRLDEILDAVELHRQRDALEVALRGLVAVIDKSTTPGIDQVALSVEYLHYWTGAKLLLASLHVEESK
jgi:hypothetical protein